MQASSTQTIEPTMVLGKALQRAAHGLGLDGQKISRTVGFSEIDVSLILRGERGIVPVSKQGQLSLMLIRVFQSLDALVGGDDAKRRDWMTSRNSALNSVPASLIESVEGLARTLAYLDGLQVLNQS